MSATRALAVTAAALLGGCATLATSTPAQPPAPCPPQLQQQAKWLMANLNRVQLGGTKSDVQTILGAPAKAESFMLTDGSMIEVLFYHTAATVCRAAPTDGGLLPFVFQNNRLLGYGQSYYQNLIIPMLRQPLPTPPQGAPQSSLPRGNVATHIPQQVYQGFAGYPTVQQQNLPQAQAQPQPEPAAGPATAPQVILPQNWQPTSYAPQVGRGQPLQ